MLASTYTVQLADLDQDRETIVGIWSRNLPAHSAEEHRVRFDWHYGENLTGLARIFLLCDQVSGKIVGTAGLGVRRFEVGGAVLDSGLAVDFAVDQEHRTIQPAIILARAVANTIEQDLHLIIAVPNEHAIGVFRRLGYVEVGSFRRFVAVLNASEYLARTSLPPMAARPFGAAMNLALRARELLSSVKNRKFRLDPLAWTDPRINSLWEQTADNAARIIGQRTSEYLRWRFQRCPLHQHQLLGLTESGNQSLLGYVVVYPGPRAQLKVPDLLCASERFFEPVLVALRHWARSHHSASIAFEAVHPAPRLQEALRTCGYVDRGDSGILFALQRSDSKVTGSFPWYFLRADEFYNTF